VDAFPGVNTIRVFWEYWRGLAASEVRSLRRLLGCGMHERPHTNFLQYRTYELRRIPLPRTSVNKGKRARTDCPTRPP
jgi:hypothetical protein